MTTPDVRVLLNPRAGAGAALRKLGPLRDRLRSLSIAHEIVETSRPGEASDLARAAARDGVRLLAVLGGDGTLNEVAQAFIDAEGNAIPGPEIAVIPSGTGGDYRRTLGLGPDLHEALDVALNRPARAVDLGVLHAVDEQQRPVVRAFLNITSFGLGGVTDRLVNEAPKWLGGTASFFLGSLRALLQYKNQPVRVRVDGELFFEGPMLNVAIAHGRYFGGGMQVAPHADPADGQFDVVALGDLSRLESVALTRTIYDGAHLGGREIHTTRGRVVEAEAVHPWSRVLIDMDGETPGQLPLKATILPGALRVRY
jgi:YegS/Rv2252/BmrU family lipid kinase